MIKTVKKLFFLLDKKEKIKSLQLIILILIMSGIQTLGIASVMPLISVLNNPNTIKTNYYFTKIGNFLSLESQFEFTFVFGLIFIFALILSNSMMALTTWQIAKYSHMKNYQIGRKLFELYIRQPYSYFLTNKTFISGSNILSEVQIVINKALLPLLQIIARFTLIFFILSLLLFSHPIITSTTVIFLFFTYFLIFYILKNKLRKIGLIRINSNWSRFKIINQAFEAIKDTKITKSEEFFLNRFSKSAKQFSHTQAKNLIIGELPKYMIETFVSVFIILSILVLSFYDKDFKEIIPSLVLFGFAGYRLLPSVQKIYKNIASIRFASQSVDHIYKEFKNTSNHATPNKLIHNDKITLYHKITINNLYYKYPNNEHYFLKNINLEIPANNIIAFIGDSGSGKTTTADILLGLLSPNHGEIYIDNTLINHNNLELWQNNVGYVPQNFKLVDGTFAENIAFGVENHDINMNCVKNAAKLANIHEFIIHKNESGYDAYIGERGNKLSGGQKQRIGIARALYFDPEFIVLDEATNSLDSKNEKIVLDSLNELKKHKTILIIFHEKEILKRVDYAYKFKHGTCTLLS